MKLQTYSQNVVNKALNMELKLIRDNDYLILYHAPATHSENQFYKINYNKLRDEINCECQKFKFSRKCSHSLKALQLIKGTDWMFNNIKL